MVSFEFESDNFPVHFGILEFRLRNYFIQDLSILLGIGADKNRFLGVVNCNQKARMLFK